MALELTINSLLKQITHYGASDLHIQVDSPPLMRLHGSLRAVPERPQLDENTVRKLFDALVSDEETLKKRYYEERAIDFSHAVPGVARFRVNLFMQQGKMGGAFRRIPEEIPTLADLAAPSILMDFSRKPRGLVLVTGPTGSGKSTTLAAVLNLINSERQDHILTIEDPIEFVHTPNHCLINQREVGRDTPSFARGLRDALREDPDVILVGEMRDDETMRIAMTAAETGHLVFGTLHTSSAPSAIDRIIDNFPDTEQSQIRTMLAASLVGIVTQTLLPRADGQGRVAAHEVLVANNPVRALIRKQETQHLRNELQTKTRDGMQTLDRALAYLVWQRVVSEEEARRAAQSAEEFDRFMESIAQGKGVPNPPKLVLPGQAGEQLAGSPS